MEVVTINVDDLSRHSDSVLSFKEEAGGVQELLHQLQQFRKKTEVLKTSMSSSLTCQHPVVGVDGICNDCCQKIENENSYGLCFRYLRRGLRLSRSEIDRLRFLESKKQLAQKKLHLVLDIDHTLVHSFRPELASELGLSKDNDTKEIANMSVKLRPFVLDFLERASTMFEMYLYTLGSRPYAKKIATILDPQGVYFGHRIISRDDNPDYSVKLKTLDLVLAEESNVLILDDTQQVWSEHQSNLILMKKFVFTGKSTDETEMTTPLNEIIKVLCTIHSAFFDEKIQGEHRCKDVRKLAATIRSTVLMGCTLYMNNVKYGKFWKMAKKLGAKFSKELNLSVTHLISCEKGTKGHLWGVRHKKYLVHAAWIEEAYYLWQRPPEERFDIAKWSST